MIRQFFIFIADQHEKLLQQITTHLGLVLVSVTFASLAAVPLGIFLSRHPRSSSFYLGLAGTFQTIPSLALLGILIPFLGIGTVPALFALFIYALLPILSNTFTGIRQIDPQLIEAAVAIGLTDTQRLWQVELPLSMPFILTGIRTAAVINVGVATLAAYVGAGGLGEFIFGGISLNNPVMMLAGAIPAALLALLIDFSLSHFTKAGVKSVLWAAYLVGGALLFTGILNLNVHLGTKSPRLLAGLTPEFIGRPDGYPGLQRVYKLQLDNLVINDAIMYKALQEGKLNVISGYSTDGRLKSYDLIILKDDKAVFPPYNAAPLVRSAILARYPVLIQVLDQLKGKISDTDMVEMNYELDFLKHSPEEVAKGFLQKKGLYHKPQTQGQGTIVLGAKIFGEQQILVNIYSQLIKGSTHLGTILKPNLGGTQICFGALLKGEIDLYPEYSGTALLVLLKPDQKTLVTVLRSKDNVFEFVSRQMAKVYGLSYLAPIGFSNSYALMMRRKQASELNINTISDLSQYIRQKN